MSGLVSAIFKSPKKPPAPPIAPPSVDNEAIAAAGESERIRNRTAKGRASSLLTGGRGLTTDATIGTKTLLG